MIVERVVVGFARLGHQVGDVDPDGVDAIDRRSDSLHQQVGKDAGIQAARTDDDSVRIDERSKHFW